MSEQGKTAIITAAITTFGLIAVAAIGKLDFSRGSPLPIVGGCKQVTTAQIAKADSAIDAIDANIGTQTNISAENLISFKATIQDAKVAIAEIRGAC